MLSVENLNAFGNFGDIIAQAYNLPDVGDIIEKHVHDENTIHITIVCKGRVRAFSHDWSVEAGAGQILDFKPYEPHAIEAIEKDTKIINVLKKHNGYIDEMVFVGNDYIPPEKLVEII